MSEENSNQSISNLIRSNYSGLNRSAKASLLILKEHLILSVLGMAALVYSSIPYLLIGLFYCLYGHHLESDHKPQITVFLLESAPYEQAETLSKMAAAVSKTEKITIIKPKMAAREVTKSFGLPVYVADQLDFPHSVLLEFPVDSDPLVLESLIRHLRDDRRVSEVASNLGTNDIFNSFKRYSFSIMIGGLLLICSVCLLFSFYYTNICGWGYLPEMIALRLLGVSETELMRPLIFNGIFLSLLFLVANGFLIFSLTDKLIPSFNQIFLFLEPEAADREKGRTGMLIYLGLSVVMIISGSILSAKKTLKISKKPESERWE